MRPDPYLRCVTFIKITVKRRKGNFDDQFFKTYVNYDIEVPWTVKFVTSYC